jgi:nucleoid-associated protein YgaU
MSALDAGLGAAASWAAAAVTAYLLLGLLAAAGENARGALGSCACGLLRLYPALVRVGLRAAVAAAVGTTVLGGSTAAHADNGRPRPPVVAPAVPAAEPLDWPVVIAPRHQSAAPPSPDAPDARRVVVRCGDSLWSLAAARLGDRSTDAAVAAWWPQWWAANRAVIGSDPDLLRPGLRLHVPPAPERSTT